MLNKLRFAKWLQYPSHVSLSIYILFLPLEFCGGLRANKEVGIRKSEITMDEESSSFLRNEYWILRHGKSIPNERGIIVSSMVCFRFLLVFFLTIFTPPSFGDLSPRWCHFRWSTVQENGTLPEFGLSIDGIKQAKLAGELLNQVRWISF